MLFADLVKGIRSNDTLTRQKRRTGISIHPPIALLSLVEVDWLVDRHTRRTARSPRGGSSETGSKRVKGGLKDFVCVLFNAAYSASCTRVWTGKEKFKPILGSKLHSQLDYGVGHLTYV